MSSSNSPNVQINSAVVRIPSLASIYQAKKSGDNSVEVLKQKFQSGIEHKIQHNSVNSRKMRDQHNKSMVNQLQNTTSANFSAPSSFSPNGSGTATAAIGATEYDNGAATKQPSVPQAPPLAPTKPSTKSYDTVNLGNISAAPNLMKGSETLRKLEREKSFEDARNAVQSQIEKIFQKQQKSQNNDSLASALNAAQQKHFFGKPPQLGPRGIGTPTLPGMLPPKQSQEMMYHSRYEGGTHHHQGDDIASSSMTNNNQGYSSRNANTDRFARQSNHNYRATLNGKHGKAPPPPPIPPHHNNHEGMPISSHQSLDAMQRQLMMELATGAAGKDSFMGSGARHNFSSLSTKHRSMDSLVTAKIASSPDQMPMNYHLSPPQSPERNNRVSSKKLHRHEEQQHQQSKADLQNQLKSRYGLKEPPKFIHQNARQTMLQSESHSKRSPRKQQHDAADMMDHWPASNARHKTQHATIREMQQMRRSISHNSLTATMQPHGTLNPRQLHHSGGNSYLGHPPFQLHPPTASMEMRPHQYPPYYGQYEDQHHHQLISSLQKHHQLAQRHHQQHHDDSMLLSASSSYPNHHLVSGGGGPMSMFGEYSMKMSQNHSAEQLPKSQYHSKHRNPHQGKGTY